MSLSLWRRWLAGSSKPCERRLRQPSRLRSFSPQVEALEHRLVPSTFLVTTTDDAGSGSLRQAILDANTNPELDTIAFNIGVGGAQTIQPTAPLPTITDPVILDGTTQPGFAGTPIIELDGSSAGVQAAGVRIETGDSTVRGLVINRFAIVNPGPAGIVIRGNGNIVEGNFIGTNITGTQTLGSMRYGVTLFGDGNMIGGTTAGARNLIAGSTEGLEIRGNGNQVRGNFIGTDITGTRALPNFRGIFLLAGSNNTIGGTTAEARNLLSGNGQYGIILGGGKSTGNRVQGNYIGTDITGRFSLGNLIGVGANVASDNIIGGTAAGERNLISGNTDTGVLIVSASGNQVQGNYIGTDATGIAPLGNRRDGVRIEADFGGNTIGGTTAAARNTIAFNDNDGVLVNRIRNNPIRRNAIFSNGRLGIELVNGGNNNQAFPVLSAASFRGSTTLWGGLTSLPNTTFTLEFFANSDCDPSGFGEGQSFVGSAAVTTDDDGVASFTATTIIAVPPGRFLTGTATDPAGNTSQFSGCVEVTRSEPLGLSVAGVAPWVIGSPDDAQTRRAIVAASTAPQGRPAGISDTTRLVTGWQGAPVSLRQQDLPAAESLFFPLPEKKRGQERMALPSLVVGFGAHREGFSVRSGGGHRADALCSLEPEPS